ncbi:response regulator [Candidatus Desantisbacteria bacterium CG_4_10_14_0_8_um_filter_48_22]|uniref:Response regulator n=1 Tax=Candidatus Desantisbacteria bacterium CG_4_10_14_0_8_um_filter_48_22 TaxID=1974543 RepID=A0A2M7S8P1_9BACT|nr:MAG: response regulator [Candidatus Desantisbacteria bacterium CG02_land_8_20_14_3_00_49_13]PIZ15882.1 MAG: response regulator [Candidatus Desantisbacteria bacterium CG_4_10_14_0_8_um_filter_48_22]
MAKILIIEDDKDLVETMKITLEEKGHVVVPAFNGGEGFSLVKSQKPDIIILDVILDKKTEGFDISYRIRGDGLLRHIPILMITAINERIPGFGVSAQTDAEFLPVDEFVEKPIPPEDLLAKVEKLLDMKVSKWANWPNKPEEK